ncbi:MAG: hypothetical protein WCQ72_03300 [Eubacteriales bacterium]
MKLNFTYDVDAARVLRDPAIYEKLHLWRHAGVGRLMLNGYFYGHEVSRDDDMSAAKRRLEDEGFEVGIINVPLGHGGNALDPNDPTIPLEVGEGWRSTCDHDGNIRMNTTCIDDKVIADTRAVVEKYKAMGFKVIFYDDDLRLGRWGGDMQGCYCPRCMEEFSALEGRSVSRSEIFEERDTELCERWMDFQCGHISRFLRGVTPDGITSGIMVMHDGGRRHGIDIKRLRREMPDNLLMRVGEAHFGDGDFGCDEGKRSLCASIRNHLALIGNNDIAFSETTVYPVGALSPDNWVEKMRLEIGCGLRNLYLMSGTAALPDIYWNTLRSALPELHSLCGENNLFS